MPLTPNSGPFRPQPCFFLTLDGSTVTQQPDLLPLQCTALPIRQRLIRRIIGYYPLSWDAFGLVNIIFELYSRLSNGCLNQICGILSSHSGSEESSCVLFLQHISYSVWLVVCRLFMLLESYFVNYFSPWGSMSLLIKNESSSFLLFSWNKKWDILICVF